MSSDNDIIIYLCLNIIEYLPLKVYKVRLYLFLSNAITRVRKKLWSNYYNCTPVRKSRFYSFHSNKKLIIFINE